MKELPGGRDGKILTDGKVVCRPKNVWSNGVQKYLKHLHENGVTFVPYPLGFNESNEELVSYIEGDVSNYPLTSQFSSSEALVSAAKLLRKIHDTSVDFLEETSFSNWMLEAKRPAQVMCHGDYAPYNVVMTSDRVTGVIDFDTTHPGPRRWDIAYAIYRWAPLKRPENPDSFGDLTEQANRAKLFCDAYGRDAFDSKGLIDIVVDRLLTLIDFMQCEASEENEDFANNIEDGHDKSYSLDVEYIKQNKEFLESVLNG